MGKTSKAENQEMERMVRREMNRFILDSGDVRITAANGIVRLHGRVRPVRGRESIFEGELDTFLKALRQRPGIHDIVVEWSIVL